MAQKIQIRRGTNTDRTTKTFDQGELVYTTDTKEVFVGDGTTVGGNRVGYVTKEGVTQIPVAQDFVDIVFDQPFDEEDVGDAWKFVGLPEVSNLVDSDTDVLNLQCGIVRERTHEGCRIYLNGTTNTANYFVKWVARVD